MTPPDAPATSETPDDELLAPYTWQQHEANEWVFGVLVRGFVRDTVGDIYFDEERDGPEGGWRWKCWPTEQVSPHCCDGWAPNIWTAIHLVEQAVLAWLKSTPEQPHA